MAKQRQRIYDQYERLVRPIALSLKANLPPSIELDDLMQAGQMGLWEAAGKYRRKDAATFNFYVRLRIRGAILDSVKGKPYREATQRELPEVLQIRDARPTVEQRMIAQEYAQEAADGRRNQLRRIQCAIDDKDPEFMPLSKRQKKVIELRFEGSGMTQEVAGRKMGVRQQSLQQMEARTLNILRRKAAA